MAQYQIPKNALLMGVEPSAMDLMPTPMGMATKEPGKFLARKLAQYLKNSEKLREANVYRMQNLRTWGSAFPESARTREAAGDLMSLQESIKEQAFERSRRMSDALDLWRLRNLPVGEAFKRGSGGVPLDRGLEEFLK